MPKAVQQFSVFLASPSDLKEDRIIFDEVIDELNQTFGKQNNIHLELLKWEKDSAPGISEEHVQNIINNGIGNEYDLFIGLLWKKFGTPTNNANSGTEEEFLRAYDRYLKTPSQIQILFYFNNSQFSPFEVDPDELKKVLEFKKDLGETKNVLYWEYKNSEQLGKFLRIHIPKRIQDLMKQNAFQLEKSQSAPQEELIEVEEVEELGLFDYQDLFFESIELSNESMNRMSEAMNWINEEFEKKTNEMNLLANNPNASRKVIRVLFIRTSKVMDNFASRIDTETPIFFDNFSTAIDAMQRTLVLYRSDFDVDMEEVKGSRDALVRLIHEMEESDPSLAAFADSIDSLPRMSKEINKSRSNLSNKLNKLRDNVKISCSIANELLKSFEDLINERGE